MAPQQRAKGAHERSGRLTGLGAVVRGLSSAKGDGIRPGGTSGRQRKNLLSDEIDKYSDGFYANATGGSRDYFLDTTRLEGDDPVAPKPVNDGCDAHDFDDLRKCLGKHVADGDAHRNITWIKAGPTYAGLLQTLIEPAERVAIQAAEPDQKEPYKVINRVTFSGSKDFPSEVLLNRNLISIIGSRSSGKSALLAFIAHMRSTRRDGPYPGRDSRSTR